MTNFTITLANQGGVAFEVDHRKSLLQSLREQGVEDVTEVRKCYLEGDGRMCVIKMKDDSSSRVRERLTRSFHRP